MMAKPWPDVPEARRQVMRGNKAKHTAPEVAVRKMLHAMGYRFRLHRRDLPGTPDIVFPGRRRAIQVHGCFWHRHDCADGRKLPQSKPEYWGPKLERNRRRDEVNIKRLHELEWHVLVVWECEIGCKGRLQRILQNFLIGSDQAHHPNHS